MEFSDLPEQFQDLLNATRDICMQVYENAVDDGCEDVVVFLHNLADEIQIHWCERDDAMREIPVLQERLPKPARLMGPLVTDGFWLVAYDEALGRAVVVPVIRRFMSKGGSA